MSSFETRVSIPDLLSYSFEILCLGSYELCGSYEYLISALRGLIKVSDTQWILNFNANECGYMMVAKGDRIQELANECGYMMLAKGDRIRGLSPLHTNEDACKRWWNTRAISTTYYWKCWEPGLWSIADVLQKGTYVCSTQRASPLLRLVCTVQ